MSCKQNNKKIIIGNLSGLACGSKNTIMGFNSGHPPTTINEKNFTYICTTS